MPDPRPVSSQVSTPIVGRDPFHARHADMVGPVRILLSELDEEAARARWDHVDHEQDRGAHVHD